MRKKIPNFNTDEEAEAFVGAADLSKYDLSGRFVKFELRKKDQANSLREPALPLKKVPIFKTNEEAQAFVDTADLSEYDLSDMVPMRFELRK